MQYLLYFLIPFFILLNYKIVISDLKNKIIPNKYLLYLLYLIPFYYIYIFFSFHDINYILFLWQIILTFLISFILFYFNIWAAWDAKYLLVLSLFIPYIWIVPFIWNIALITIFYLLLYFIYFYLWKIVFNKKYRKSLCWNIKKDLNKTFEIYKNNKWWNIYKIIAKFLLIFFIIFVSIRLSRIYLFNNLLENWNNISYLSQIIEKYNIYLIFLLIAIFIWWLYLLKLSINKFKKYISDKLNINLELIWNVLIWILFILLSSFIIYELINNYNKISNLLFRIFTLYLAIYIFIKILIYSYKITFWISQRYSIDINKLKNNDTVDIKELLIILKEDSEVYKKYNLIDNPSIKNIKKAIKYSNNVSKKIILTLLKILHV